MKKKVQTSTFLQNGRIDRRSMTKNIVFAPIPEALRFNCIFCIRFSQQQKKSKVKNQTCRYNQKKDVGKIRTKINPSYNDMQTNQKPRCRANQKTRCRATDTVQNQSQKNAFSKNQLADTISKKDVGKIRTKMQAKSGQRCRQNQGQDVDRIHHTNFQNFQIAIDLEPHLQTVFPPISGQLRLLYPSTL